MVGCENSVATFQQRFKSCPIKLHRLLPRKTPSGFTIGTTLNMKFLRRIIAIGWLPSRNSSRPWHTNEAADSPGCERASTTITRRKFFPSIFAGFSTWSMVIRSSFRPCCLNGGAKHTRQWPDIKIARWVIRSEYTRPHNVNTYQSDPNWRINECIRKFGLENAQIRLKPRITVRRCQSKLIDLIFFLKCKGKTKNVVVLMDGRTVVKNMLLWYALPAKHHFRFIEFS